MMKWLGETSDNAPERRLNRIILPSLSHERGEGRGEAHLSSHSRPPAYCPHSRSRRGASSGGVLTRRSGGAASAAWLATTPRRPKPRWSRLASPRVTRATTTGGPVRARSSLVRGAVPGLQRWIEGRSPPGASRSKLSRAARGMPVLPAACGDFRLCAFIHSHTGPRALRRSGIPRAPRRGGAFSAHASGARAPREREGVPAFSPRAIPLSASSCGLTAGSILCGGREGGMDPAVRPQDDERRGFRRDDGGRWILRSSRRMTSGGDSQDEERRGFRRTT